VTGVAQEAIEKSKARRESDFIKTPCLFTNEYIAKYKTSLKKQTEGWPILA
jgi:hypothetical protein